MKVTYTKGWFRANKRPLAIWDEKMAEKAHNEKKPYTVLLGDSEKPYAFLEVKLGIKYVIVNFLDEQLRDYLEYQFQEREPGKLFLAQSLQRIYAGDSDRVTRAETYRFNPQGNLSIRESNLEKEEQRVKEATEKVDVSGNWEEVPEFGNYELLARIER